MQKGSVGHKQRGEEMKFSCSTFYISHPAQVKHGQLQRTTAEDNKIIDYFLSIKAEQTDIDPNQTWKTNWYTHVEHQDIIGDLLDQIHSWYCLNVCEPRGPAFLTGQEYIDPKNLHIDANVWFQEYVPGHVSQQHEHGLLSRYSWVYYLKCEEDPSPLTFVQRGLNQKQEINNVDELHLPVYNKMLVMFPSFIHHKVYPANSKRYVLAGNINDIVYEENK
tara:strand:- start:614 stop:1273 length:660 start_codon:yes stop_codon:yes gene_type:complete